MNKPQSAPSPKLRPPSRLLPSKDESPEEAVEQKKKEIRISRNGLPLMRCHSDEVEGLIASGSILPSDQFYDETAQCWSSLDKDGLPTEQKVQPVQLATATPPPEETSPPTLAEPKLKEAEIKTASQLPAQKLAGKPRKSQRSSLAVRQVIRWATVFCVLLGLAFVALLAFSFRLAHHLSDAKLLAANLRHEADNLRVKLTQAEDDYARVTELVPAGQIECAFIYRPDPSTQAPMIGVAVQLFHRTDVEQVLQKLHLLNRAASWQTMPKLSRVIIASLPHPLSISLTNMEGRVRFAVPAPGDYVLVTAGVREISGDPTHFLWMVGFRDTQHVSYPILMDEENAISAKNPVFSIREATPFAKNGS